MIFSKPHAQKYILLPILLLFSFLSINAQEGKTLFQQNCQSCHALDRRMNGPALRGFQNRGPWGDRKQLHDWVHNPAAFMAKDPYTQGLKAEYGAIMQAFPDLTDAQIDAIADYIATVPEPGAKTSGGNDNNAPDGTAGDTGGNALLFGIISLILAIVALILTQVNSNLKKLSDDKENIRRPEAVPFYRNKIYIALVALVLFVVGGYLVAKGAVNLGRQQGYQPTQPIYYSHRVHVGVNQINCLYCHGPAWESKHATIPSINICMNCHKAINAYEKGPKMYDEDGNEINGTAEIQKLYEFAGYKDGDLTWDASKAKPIEWIKIHNVPDHVYFNHSQHVNAGKVACQSCHGNIQEMDEVHQVSDLSMGWCINCHRESKVDFYNPGDSTGNKFYSIYEKFHNDMKSGAMDSVTVERIGGIECQKCHY